MNCSFTKIRIILLSIVLVLLLSPTFGFALDQAFTDIESHWAKSEIEKWSEKGLINGYKDGSYKPNDNITRAEFITLVNNVINIQAEEEIIFEDVDGNEWYYKDLKKAIYGEYIAGYDDNTFRANDNITRQEVAVILQNLVQLNASEEDFLGKFVDTENTPNWSRTALNLAVQKGYLTGYKDKSLKASNYITRAESVKVLSNVFGIIYNEAGTYGPAVYEEVLEVKGNVTVSVEDVTLQNMVIDGDLYLAEGIGEGDVTLDNITILGETIVKGGGENSIIIKNSSLKNLFVIKKGGSIRIVLEDTLVILINTSSPRTIITGNGNVGTINANEGSDDSVFTVPDAIVIAFAPIKVNETEVNEGEEVLINDEGTDVVREEEKKTTTSITRYTVNYDVIGSGGTIESSISSGDKVKKGTDLTFTATPSEGYEILEWKVNDVTTTASGITLTKTINSNTSVTVEFIETVVEPTMYTVTYSVIGEGGTLTASVLNGEQVQSGSSVDFTAVPAKGFQLKEWTVNGKVIDWLTGLNVSRDMIGDVDFKVEFEEIPVVTYPLTITVTPDDAVITVTDSLDNVMTGSFNGIQTTYNLPAGIYDIKIEKEGYVTQEYTQNMVGPSSHIINLEEVLPPSDDLKNISFKGGTYNENITTKGFEFTPTIYEYTNVIIPYNFVYDNPDYFDIYVEENTTDGNSTLQINETVVDIDSYKRIYINPGETKTIEIIYTQTDKSPKIYTLEISRSTDVELINIAGQTSVTYGYNKHGFSVEKETINKEDITVTDGASVTFYENISPYNIEVSNQTVVNNPGLYDEFWIEILGADGITSKKYLVGITRKIEFLEISSEWTQSVLSVSLKYSGPLDLSKTPDANQFSILINNQETIAYYAQGNDNILKVQFNNPAGSTTESAIGIFKYLPNDLNPVKDSLGNTPKEHGLLNVSIEGKPISIVSASAERVDFSGDSIDDLKIEITYDGSLMQDTSSVLKGYFTIDLTSREEDPSPNIAMTDSNKLYLIYNNFYNNIYRYTNISKELKYTNENINLKDISGNNVKIPDSVTIIIPE